MMKQNLIPFTAVLAAFALVSCDGGKKQDQSPDASAASEQAVPKTPGEKILAVLLLIQDQATANAHAAEVKELAVALPKDIPHQESVNIMNELLRLASRECYGSLSLEDAACLWTWMALNLPRTSRKSKFPVPGNDGLFLRLSHPVLPGRERRCFSGAGYGK